MESCAGTFVGLLLVLTGVGVLFAVGYFPALFFGASQLLSIIVAVSVALLIVLALLIFGREDVDTNCGILLIPLGVGGLFAASYFAALFFGASQLLSGIIGGLISLLVGLGVAGLIRWRHQNEMRRECQADHLVDQVVARLGHPVSSQYRGSLRKNLLLALNLGRVYPDAVYRSLLDRGTVSGIAFQRFDSGSDFATELATSFNRPAEIDSALEQAREALEVRDLCVNVNMLCVLMEWREEWRYYYLSPHGMRKPKMDAIVARFFPEDS